MSGASLILLGAGGHARACIDVVEHHARFDIIGLTGRIDEVGTRVLGYPVLGTDDDLANLLAVDTQGIVSVGQIKTAELRMKLFSLLERNGRITPPIVSPRAYVSRHALVGEGTIVMHGAVINAGAVVGRNCIVNSLALIEHDVQVADHCHVSTGAVLNSSVRVGAGTFVGSGSSVRQGAVIGAGCVIGMAQRVLRDCQAGTWLPHRR